MFKDCDILKTHVCGVKLIRLPNSGDPRRKAAVYSRPTSGPPPPPGCVFSARGQLLTTRRALRTTPGSQHDRISACP